MSCQASMSMRAAFFADVNGTRFLSQAEMELAQLFNDMVKSVLKGPPAKKDQDTFESEPSNDLAGLALSSATARGREQNIEM